MVATSPLWLLKLKVIKIKSTKNVVCPQEEYLNVQWPQGYRLLPLNLV